ncbi:MAG: glutamate racemase [Saprospiraceae bacterium]|nr:glutamate racemase [Saprospiraceae bacterium]MBP7699851.1 glutamate racemase [Saprospiraceae bacterium]
MMRANQPIGIFDSGIGGLTVANAISRTLPNEQIIYFGDTAHLPYGEKSHDAIRYYCLKIVKFLLEKKCKMIVVACNSAATAAYDVLLEFFDQHALFVNVVDPLVNEVVAKKFNKVGIIATKATISSGIYEKKLQEKQPTLQVATMATPLLAPMIEEGFVHNKISLAVLENYFTKPIFNDIEALLLACTHYPLIRTDIAACFTTDIQLFDSTFSVAEAVRQKLSSNGLLNQQTTPPAHNFYVSDYTPSFEESTQLFYGASVSLEANNIW